MYQNPQYHQGACLLYLEKCTQKCSNPLGYSCTQIYNGCHDYTLIRKYIYYTSGSMQYFSRFSCWGDFILRKIQNQFCACPVHPEKYESGSLFNINITASLRDVDCVLLRSTTKV